MYIYMCIYIYAYKWIYICIYIYIYIYIDINVYIYTYIYTYTFMYVNVQPIAYRVAKKIDIMSKNFQFSTRRTRILMGFIISTIYHLVLIVNPMGRILVRWIFLQIISRFCSTLSAIGCMYKTCKYIYIYIKHIYINMCKYIHLYICIACT